MLKRVGGGVGEEGGGVGSVVEVAVLEGGATALELDLGFEGAIVVSL